MNVRRSVVISMLCGIALMAGVYAAFSFLAQRQLDMAVARVDSAIAQSDGAAPPPLATGDATDTGIRLETWATLRSMVPADSLALLNDLIVPEKPWRKNSAEWAAPS